MISARRANGRVAALLRAHRGDVIGVFVLVGLVVAFLSPAAKDGWSFGGFDFDVGTASRLGQGLYASVHSVKNGDALSQMISWNALDWRAIHAGQFPLWNDYSVLGMAQFANFESSVLSLPDLLSYAVPIEFAFLLVVAVKLLIAASGVYVLLRVLGARPLAACLGGASFMFAGAFVGWITWPLSDVFAWSGWIAAFALLSFRSRGAARIAGLALCVAFSIYGGFPEADVMLLVVFAVTVIVAAALGVRRRATLPWRGAARVSGGALLGALLAAPLWLPGLQIIAISHRESEGRYAGLPVRTIGLLLSQGYFGLPIGANQTFQFGNWNYYESVSYVGAIAVVLALVALLTVRRPVVACLGVALVVTLGLTYEPWPFHPFQELVNAIPTVSAVRFERVRTASAFILSVLAGLGLDRLLAEPGRIGVRRAYLGATALVALALGVLALAALRAGPALSSGARPVVVVSAAVVRHQRLDALIWPAGLLAVLIAGGVLLLAMARGAPPALPGRVLAGLLVVSQVAFLFFAGVGIPSYSSRFYPASAAERTLAADVGGQLLGLDGGNVTDYKNYAHLGYYPNVNIGYGVVEFAVHDPLIPAGYFQSWPVPQRKAGAGGVGLFTPAITSAALARRYGIGFILAGRDIPAPAGTVRITTVAKETLYRVPGAARFSFESAPDVVRSVREAGNGHWELTTAGRTTGRLVARVTALPGMHVAIDGRPAPLQTYETVMESVVVPPGVHRISLWYFPPRLRDGIDLALLGAIVFLSYAASEVIRSRAARTSQPSNPSGSSPASD